MQTLQTARKRHREIIAITVLALALWATRVYWAFIILYIIEAFTAERLNKAFEESELSGKKYILAKTAVVTGYDWVLIKDENGKEEYEYIRIVGPDPHQLVFMYDFYVSDNTYIFYIEERRNVYFEDIREEGFEYVVTGWNILYPVKHLFYPIDYFFHTRRYITEMDTHIGYQKFHQKVENVWRILGCGRENESGSL